MKIDLNLFTVFEAIYCEGSITKAASVLNLSQPAVSHSLSKLRDHFNDPLFIRRGNEMRPTPIANNVIADVREALQQLKVCLVQSTQFIPEVSHNNFNISLHGGFEGIYLPSFIHKIKKQAPNIYIQSSKRVNRNELETKLASGDIDIAIDSFVPVSENILHTQLGQEKFVVLARKNHSKIKKILTLDHYLQQEHIVVSSRSVGQSIEDFELNRLGYQRTIALRCQHALTACRIIAHNDMLLTISESTAKIYTEMLDLAAYPLPIKLHNLEIHLYWHRNADIEPANQWLRKQVIESADILKI